MDILKRPCRLTPAGRASVRARAARQANLEKARAALAAKVQSQTERCLRRLLRKRSGGAIVFKLLSPRRESRMDQPGDRRAEELIQELRGRGSEGKGNFGF